MEFSQTMDAFESPDEVVDSNLEKKINSHLKNTCRPSTYTFQNKFENVWEQKVSIDN